MIYRRRSRPPTWRDNGTVLAEAKQLSVNFGGTAILDRVDMTAIAGQVLALVGPNGAGKSTLLSAVATDLPIAAGALRIDGQRASNWSAPELAMRRAVLPQQSLLSFPFTVTEVVEMGRAPWAGRPTSNDDEREVAEAMRLCEITELAHRAFPSLSGGERARVAMARVLAQRTQLILLDEPTAALDLRHQELVLRLCRSRAAAGCAVVVVLHDLGLAAAYCDSIAIIHDGRIAGHGPPESVLEAQLLSRVYRQAVDVLPHPRGGELLVLPKRDNLRLG